MLWKHELSGSIPDLDPESLGKGFRMFYVYLIPPETLQGTEVWKPWVPVSFWGNFYLWQCLMTRSEQPSLSVTLGYMNKVKSSNLTQMGLFAFTVLHIRQWVRKPQFLQHLWKRSEFGAKMIWVQILLPFVFQFDSSFSKLHFPICYMSGMIAMPIS
jgi:hypothetical protein